MEEHNCILEDLLTNKFSSRTFQERLQIVTNGQPCPELPNLVTAHKGKKGEYTRHFSSTQYQLIPWITGCEKLNKLFCWPCVLFSNENGVWTKTGFSDLSHLSLAQQRHERSQTHVDSFIKCKLFGKQRINVMIDSQHKANINLHNEQVKKNREILKRLIDAICYLAKQELPLRAHDESATYLNRGNYLEFLEALRGYDPLLDSHLKTATVFRGNSPAVENDIIVALRDVLLDEIKKEISGASFASIMLDETSNVMCKSQLSTMLRYVKDGAACERFVGFTDVSLDKTASGLFNHVISIVEEYKIGDKLVGQTYDGASVMSGHLNELQSKVLEVYPNALFTHCYAHVLTLVLQQGLSNIKECRIFFQTLSGLSAFFSKSTKKKVVLEDFVHRKVPSVSPIRWNFTSRVVHTVKEHRMQLIEFFEYVIENSNEWDANAVVKSKGFISFLSDFDTIFQLEIFTKLFSITDVLYNALQTKKVDIVCCNQKMNDTLLHIQSGRQDAFETLWNLASLKKNNDDAEPKTKRACFESGDQFYRRLYCEIIDNLVEQIKTRYTSFSKLAFFQLLAHQKFDNYRKTFPDELINKLRLAYGTIFDHIRLKSELTVIYVSPEFQGLSIFELVKFIKDTDLLSVLKEVYKLSELILTIPSTGSSVARSFSALKRIHSYCRYTQSQDHLNGFSIISIEKEMLQDLRVRLKDSFYDLVIEKFLSKESRLELVYK